LTADAARVLRELAPIEREIRSFDGNIYLARLRPYRTTDDRIDGIVITFVDVTERRQMESDLRDSEQRFSDEMRLVDLANRPIFVWEYPGGRITQWNNGCERYYGYSRNEAVGSNIDDLLKTGTASTTRRRTLDRGAVWNGPLDHRAKNGQLVAVESTQELIAADGGQYVLQTERKPL
jgi:two-component system CheB/CheR fusion protein